MNPLNSYHRSEHGICPSHCNDNTKFLTHCSTKELPVTFFNIITFKIMDPPSNMVLTMPYICLYGPSHPLPLLSSPSSSIRGKHHSELFVLHSPCFFFNIVLYHLSIPYLLLKIFYCRFNFFHLKNIL